MSTAECILSCTPFFSVLQEHSDVLEKSCRESTRLIDRSPQCNKLQDCIKKTGTHSRSSFVLSISWIIKVKYLYGDAQTVNITWGWIFRRVQRKNGRIEV